MAMPCISGSQSPASRQGVPGLLRGPFRKYGVQSDSGTGFSLSVSFYQRPHFLGALRKIENS